MNLYMGYLYLPIDIHNSNRPHNNRSNHPNNKNLAHHIEQTQDLHPEIFHQEQYTPAHMDRQIVIDRN